MMDLLLSQEKAKVEDDIISTIERMHQIRGLSSLLTCAICFLAGAVSFHVSVVGTPLSYLQCSCTIVFCIAMLSAEYCHRYQSKRKSDT